MPNTYKKLLATGVYRLFDFIFNIRREEFWLVQLFLIYLTVLTAGYVVVSTSAITLFLSRTNTSKLHELLPWIYIGNAVTIATVAHYYRKFIDVFSRIKLISYATLFFMSSFLIIRFIISFPASHTWIYFFLTLWDDTTTVLFIMMFYAYLGDYFHEDDGKRIYPYITGGMAIGTPLGGFGSSYFLHFFPAPDLLYLSTILLGVATLFSYFIFKNFATRNVDHSEATKLPPISIKDAFSNKYLRLLLLIGAFSVFCTCIDTYQMYYVASKTLTEKEMGSFIGSFFGYTGITLLIVDYLLAKWLLKAFGVLGSLFILPILFILLCFGFITYPILVFAAAIKFMDGTLSLTVNTFSTQTLFLPLPERMRVYGLSLSVGVMASGARLFAGLLLVTLSFLAIPTRYYSMIILLVAVIWIFCIMLLFPLYKKIMLPQKSG